MTERAPGTTFRRSTEPSRPVRVLTPFRGPDPNPTVTMLVDSLPDDVTPVHFEWRRAFRGDYDVLHLHWPDHLVKDPRLSRRIAKRLALFALTLVNRLRRTAMVWTVHNQRPHDGAIGLEQLVLATWERLATARVYMYQAALPEHPTLRDVVIKRGDYSPLYAGFERSETRGDGLLVFGLIRPYKGIESLISAIHAMPPAARPSLLVAGEARDAGYAEALTASAADLPMISFDLRSIPDEDLARLIQGSAMVVLPYRYMYNSGAALLALTLRRPILVPASPTMLELRREVGERWVQTYEGDLGPGALAHALQEIALIDERDRPDLSERDWTTVGRNYADLYRSIIR